MILFAAPAVFLLINAAMIIGFLTVHFNTMVRLTYGLNTLVMPIVFLASAVLACWRGLGAMPPHHHIRRLGVLWVLFAISLVGLRIYATHIEPRMLKVRHVTLVSEKINHPVALLHISDIQSAAIGSYEESVFDRIRALNPDLIVHTGDLLQPVPPATYRSELTKLAALFETLSPPLGMYMVQGDTTGPLIHASTSDMGGIVLLQNQEARIAAEGILIRIYGLTLRSSTAHTWARDGIRRWLQEEPDALNIVMGHRPDFILKFNDLPMDLCLAGHTHGGQIRIPFFGPIVTFSNIPRDWARGFRKVGNTWLNVSAGIGAEHARGLPSIRFNCPPEMTLFHIEPAPKKN